MSSPVLAVEEDCRVPEAAHLIMFESGIGRLPVMKDNVLIRIADKDIFLRHSLKQPLVVSPAPELGRSCPMSKASLLS